MIIAKHKDIDLTLEQILHIAKTREVPSGIVIDITPNGISVSPEGKGNLFGLITSDYELLLYEE